MQIIMLLNSLSEEEKIIQGSWVSMNAIIDEFEFDTDTGSLFLSLDECSPLFNHLEGDFEKSVIYVATTQEIINFYEKAVDLVQPCSINEDNTAVAVGPI